jgi:predicted XRE-type DNA-binding protein
MKTKQNVFADLGFDFEEAEHLRIRADLMLELRKFIEKKKLTQKEAAKFFGETQPRISNLLNGHIERFSVDKLIAMLHKAGVRVHIETEVIKKAA